MIKSRMDILGESASIFKLQQQSFEQDASDRKVLICDDCPFNIVAVQSLIQQFNFTADFCSNGKEAIEMVEQKLEQGQPSYKLIMLDFSMPQVDGPTCCLQIKDLLT